MERRMARGSLRAPERGFTYVWLLLAVAVIAIGLSAASEVWVTSGRRERIVQAEWAASQIVAAIGGYYEGSPGGSRVYPSGLSELLEDERFPVVRRHLRTLYPNPLAHDGQWELIRAGDGRIRGVRWSVPWKAESAHREYVYLSAAGS